MTAWIKIFVGNISRRLDTAEMGNIAKRSDHSLKFPSKLENRETLEEKAKKERFAVFLTMIDGKARRCISQTDGRQALPHDTGCLLGPGP